MTLLIKDFVKKYLVLVFLFSKNLQHFHNNFSQYCELALLKYILRSFNIFIGMLHAHPAQPNSTQPISLFFFFFFLFLPILLSHKSQPYTFCLLSFSPFSTFLHTFSHTAYTHAILHLDLLYSFFFSKFNHSRMGRFRSGRFT